MRAAPRVTIVIPVLDEEESLGEVLRGLPRFAAGSEVRIADGGSRDGTMEVARACRGELERRGFQVTWTTGERGRGRQMNDGAAGAGAEVLLFLHADTLLPPEAPACLARALSRPEVVGGGFRHRFREGGFRLGLVSAGSNLRARLTRVLYGDQAIFVRAAAFRELGGFRPLPVFEDADLVRRMRRLGRTVLLPCAVRTSGRRFLQEGVMRTVLRHARMKLARLLRGDGGSSAGDYWEPARRGLRRRSGR